MEITKNTFYDTMEEVLEGDCVANYITKSEMAFRIPVTL